MKPPRWWCEMCRTPLADDEVHWPHESDECPPDLCACSVAVCAACCPECAPAVIAGQLDIFGGEA